MRRWVCDRCGEPKAINTIIFRKGYRHEKVRTLRECDVCDKCFKELFKDFKDSPRSD